MDFNDTPEEATYRRQARDWLETNVAEHKAGNHADDMAAARMAGAQGRGRLRPDHLAQGMGRGRRHPDPVGDLGQEEGKHPVQYGYFTIGLGMCVPTVMAFANDEHDERFVGPALRRGDLVAALLRARRRLRRRRDPHPRGA
ncbi:hypothetical protein AB5I41_18485 [Sphingomonas sp. MMS24-JH45]